LFALVVGLVASTIYFLISPVEDPHSEILARTQPTVCDVLIVLFDGFAGFIVVSSKTKVNVMPAVAIATAGMPPLCTAGYGLAARLFFWRLLFVLDEYCFYGIGDNYLGLFIEIPNKKIRGLKYSTKEKS
jgi:hypothetical protein